MHCRDDDFYFSPTFNFGVNTPLVAPAVAGGTSPPPFDSFFLLDGTNFLLLDGSDFLLLGS